MRDAVIEGLEDHLPGALERRGTAEVLPKPQ